MKKLFLAALACVCLLVAQNDLNAQITWSPSVDLFDTGDNLDFVSQNGVFVLGVNPGGMEVTAGTAVFANAGGTANASLLRAAGGVSSTQNGVTFTGDFDNIQVGGTFNGGSFQDENARFLLTTAAWNNAYDAATPDTVTLSGLTPGDTYEIQVIVNDARTAANRSRDTQWEVAFTNGADALVAATADLNNRDYIPTPDDPAVGEASGDYIIGTFVAAESGTQSWSMSATRGDNLPQDQFTVGESIDITANDPAGAISGGQTQINAIQLRNISDVDDVLLGDASLNGIVNFLDIGPFITILAGDEFVAQADTNQDGFNNFSDIASFIQILSEQ